MGKKYLTKEMAINLIMDRLDKGLSVRYTDLKREHPKILFYIEKNGGVTRMMEELGFSREELVMDYGFHPNILPRLTENEIKDMFLELKRRGMLNTNRMRIEYYKMGLETQAIKMFGSIDKAFEYFGLTRDLVVVTKESIFKDLQYHIDNGDDLNYVNMMLINSKLVSSVNNHFSMGWNEFILYNNIEFDNGYKKKSIRQGLEFQKSFKDVLDALNIDYIYNKVGAEGCIPDFQLSKNHWLDCKLSSWTSSIPRTVEKYLKYCNKVTIVYYRGKNEHLHYLKEKYKDKIQVINIEEYYEKLASVNRLDLVEKLKSLL